MKFRLALLAIALLAAAMPALATSYSAGLAATQNPISENGMWLNGKTNGGNWNDCAMLAGFIYGTQPNADGAEQYADAACALTGTWGPNQVAQATVSVPNTITSGSAEVELRLNTTIKSGSITGYEFNCSTNPTESYAQIVRWNGGLGQFTAIGWANTTCRSGDVLKATRSGSTLTFYKNGSVIATANDSSFTGGSPGVGFYNQNTPAEEEDFGFSSFSATDGNSSLAGTGAASITLTYGLSSSSTPDDPGTVSIYRAALPSGGSCGGATLWTLLTASAPLSGTYVDSTAQNGTVYCYGAVFTRDGLESAMSNIYQANPPNGGTTFSPPQPLSPVPNFSGKAN